MTLNEIHLAPKGAKTLTLFTGNIMTDGGRVGFLNTSMSKNNAEVPGHSSRSMRLISVVGQFAEEYTAE
jgi:hypothetical protein